MTKGFVVDANMVFAALVRDGETRRVMMTSPSLLYAPRFLRVEIEKHKPEIVRRSGGTSKDVELLLATLYRRITWVSDSKIRPFVGRATKLLGSIDPKDVPYLAYAMAVDADGIWSRDPHFDRQSAVPRVTVPR